MKTCVSESIMRPSNDLDKPLHCAHARVQYVICGFVCLAVNCFSSRFIMAQGENRRQRTFLD